MHCKERQSISENLGQILTRQKISDQETSDVWHPKATIDVNYSKLEKFKASSAWPESLRFEINDNLGQKFKF